MKIFMEKIIAGTTTWAGVKEHYAPSLTYAEDSRGKIGEYVPEEMDEGSDDMVEGTDEPISKAEATEMKEEASKTPTGGITRSGNSFR
jgi:hypothetical protein